MQLYLLSYEEFFTAEVRLVSEMLANHEFIFHLRKPEASVVQYRAFLNQIPEELHPKIMLHDAFELIHEFNLRGLHFSTQKRKNRQAYQKVYCSTSSHSLAEAEEQEKLFDYQFLSPVFPSISKPGYTGNLNLAEVKEYLDQKRDGKIIALGGISENNIVELYGYKFDGAAVLGSVWGSNPRSDEKILNRFNKIYSCIKSVHTV